MLFTDNRTKPSRDLLVDLMVVLEKYNILLEIVEDEKGKPVIAITDEETDVQLITSKDIAERVQIDSVKEDEITLRGIVNYTPTMRKGEVEK